MCSTRRHISGCAPLWEEVRASIVPAFIHSNVISKFICRVNSQRLVYSPWIRNFFRAWCDRDRPDGGSSTEFLHCEDLTESSFHQFATHFDQICNILSRNRGSFVQQFRYCLRNARRRARNLGDESWVYLVPVVILKPIFHGFCSTIIPPIDCRNFLANLPLMMSFDAIIKSDGHLRTAHISNARHLIVPEVPDFSCGRFNICWSTSKLIRSAMITVALSQSRCLWPRGRGGGKDFSIPLSFYCHHSWSSW
jgi:hypothetical protein